MFRMAVDPAVQARHGDLHGAVHDVAAEHPATDRTVAITVVCPVGAIFPEDDVPAGQEGFLALNAELAPLWPVLDKKIPAPEDAAEWDGVPDKLKLLER